MKKQTLIISVFIFFPYLLFSQELINNFAKTDENTIYWQKIKETKLTFEKLYEKIVESGNFENIEKFDNKIVCKFKPYTSNYKAYGYSYMRTPFYISKNLIEANIIFKYKPGKYRITIKNIQLIQNNNDAFSAQGEVETFESWVLNKKGRVKMNFFKDGSNILNKDFTAKTTFIENTNEKW